LNERARVRGHYGPLCVTLVAAKSRSIRIAVVSASGGIIVFSERLVPKLEVAALGVITISHGCFERCGSNKKTPL